HLERGHFLLDFGGALYEHGATLENDELAKQACEIFRGCERCAKESGDWVTNSRANLMLARLYTGGGSFAEARRRLRLATTAAEQTRDNYLKDRIAQWSHSLDELEKKL